jgi:hypothetical protein
MIKMHLIFDVSKLDFIHVFFSIKFYLLGKQNRVNFSRISLAWKLAWDLFFWRN